MGEFSSMYCLSLALQSHHTSVMCIQSRKSAIFLVLLGYTAFRLRVGRDVTLLHDGPVALVAIMDGLDTVQTPDSKNKFA